MNTLRGKADLKLADLFFNAYQKRALGLLLLHPEEKYHVREIARLTSTIAGTLHKELARLADAGVLNKQAVGNQVFYGANRDCPIFEELAGILRKTSGVVDVLAEALKPLAVKIHVALVFGSMARGKETAGSDVDLLIVGDMAFSDVVKALHPAQILLNREINPKVYTRAEWKKLRGSHDSFINEVMDSPKLLVMGDKDELGKPGRPNA